MVIAATRSQTRSILLHLFMFLFHSRRHGDSEYFAPVSSSTHKTVREPGQVYMRSSDKGFPTFLMISCEHNVMRPASSCESIYIFRASLSICFILYQILKFLYAMDKEAEALGIPADAQHAQDVALPASSAERKRVLNILAQRRYRKWTKQDNPQSLTR
jgi:hypothetical protein